MEFLIGFILIFVVILAFFSKKMNIPLIIIALITGVVFGSDVTGIVYFDNAVLTKNIANAALMFILFYGGYGTKKENLKPVIKITLVLATVGVLLTAILTGVIFSFVSGWDIYIYDEYGNIATVTKAEIIDRL